ncbi:MAG: co-chaperone GroES [Methanosarcinaceae archaeon]|nr:co-chaperone GroES [Methanosarcinaceae archaeon]
MIIRPIGERVLIKAVKKAEVTESGIFIPDTAQEEKKEGIVVGVGTFEDGKALPLKSGDHVVYGGYRSDEIDIDGEKHLFIDFKDILAVVEE